MTALGRKICKIWEKEKKFAVYVQGDVSWVNAILTKGTSSELRCNQAQGNKKSLSAS